MAILNNLIVHGSSRFLNGINTDSIHTNLIDADSGIFKTITTTTLDAGTITTDMLTATNARVSQTLTVDGTISTNKWEAANIANIGGNFYISPTGKADSGTITVTKTSTTTVNGVSVGVYTLVVGSASFGVTSTSSTIWGTSSKVIFTGSISYNGSKKYPLGTCNGTMTTVSTGTNILTGFTITGINSPALDIFFKEVGISSVSSIACSGYEMQISVYQSYYSSALHPIGILLTSYGKEKKQYIDIYGGANTLGDSDSGYADPAVRIGQLDGLPNIVDGSTAEATKPTGWGVYTNNGFFKGKIVSNAGVIANFTINGSKLYSNGHSAYDTATTGIYIGDDYISFGSGGVTYFNTSGTGKVGPWTLSTTYFRNGNIASATNTSVAGVYLGTDGLNISNGTAATTSYITKSAVNIGNKLTWNGTTLSVNGNITSTSGQIGPWFINANSISRNANGNAAGAYNTASNMYFGTSGLSLGTSFTVTSAGVLTATNAILKVVSLQDSNGNTRATVDANGLTVKDTSGNVASIFGAGTATIGYTSGNKYNIDITGTAIDLRYNTNVLNRINSGGMTLYDGQGIADSNIIAKFGTNGAQIGQTGKTRVEIDFRSMQLVDKDDDTYFYLGDLLTADGLIEYETIANGVDDYMYRLPTYIQTPLDLSKTLVTVDGVPQTWGLGSARPYIFTDLVDTTCVEFPGNTPPQNAVIFIQYKPLQYVETKYLTYGSRAYAQACGGFSSVFGKDCSAVGANSFAQGKGTRAFYANTVAIGRYNYINEDIIQMFIVGNGTADDARSNALTVDWNGNVWCAGGITATPTEITMTYNQCTTGSYSRCYRIGNMVFLSFNINVTTATASYDYITGLPSALGGGWATSSGFGSGAMTRWWITTSGTLRADGKPTAGWHNGSVVYICQ